MTSQSSHRIGSEMDIGARTNTADSTLTSDPMPRVLLMGARRSGKTSIQRVVFNKMSPHETLFLESTSQLDIKIVTNNPFVQYYVWDFPGDFDFHSDLMYSGDLISDEVMFGLVSALVLVIDSQDEPYQEAVSRIVDIVSRAQVANPNIFFEVFIHKVDGDLFLSDENKIDCQRDIQQCIQEELTDAGMDATISYYLTSIYDHSIFEALSKVVQKLITQMPTLETLLNLLTSNCNMEKSFLFDVVSRIYLATDSSPVDMQSYELCSDMIDAVIDVSCIYGVVGTGANEHENLVESSDMAFDSESSSVIRLNNGMILYLREVNSYLALVCLVRENNFKKGFIDYNIDCFKTSLRKVFIPASRPQPPVLE